MGSGGGGGESDGQGHGTAGKVDGAGNRFGFCVHMTEKACELCSRGKEGGAGWGTSDLEDVLDKNCNLEMLNSHMQNPVPMGQRHVQNQNGLGIKNTFILFSGLNSHD